MGGEDGPLRRGGVLPAGDGARVLWSVAEGRRGRRWRFSRTDATGAGLSALLEVDPAGSHRRLEVTAPAGLLTLHPEPDQSSAHGNVVTPAGIRHLAFPWGPTWRFDVVDLPWVATVEGGEGTVDLLRIDRDLEVVRAARLLTSAEHLAIPAGGRSWPLEVAPGAIDVPDGDRDPRPGSRSDSSTP